MTVASEPALVVMGYGVSDTLQLTVESQRLLPRFKSVYTLAAPPNLRRYLQAQNIRHTDLSVHFDQDRPHADAYLDVIDVILKSVAEDPPVGLLTQGNPLFMNSITRTLLIAAQRTGFVARALPAVSPLDAAISELGIDVATFGLQVFDASRLVSRDQTPNTAVPLLVLQLAGLGCQTTGSVQSPLPDRLVPLQAHLLRFYSGEQPVTLLNPGNGHRPTARATTSLANLSSVAEHVVPESQLFIDAVR
ncbi:MAG: hypothetical protein KJ048_01805 [Dehalococcoidia bacterium]|nr:hypothetical protein [Dehalococcoidia bacterium]